MIFGQTGWALILSMCVLVAANVAIWGAYIFKVFPSDEKPAVFGILASLGFLVCFLPTYCTSILANALLLIFVGLVFHLLAALAEDASKWGGVMKSVCIGLLLGVGIFTHNSSIIYVVAAVTVIMVSMPTPLRQRLIAVGFILFIFTVAWMNVPSHGLRMRPKTTDLAVAAGASTTSSAPLEGSHFLFDPKYSFAQYLVQTPQGFGVFFISTPWIPAQAALGALILATALYFLIRQPETKLESRQRVFLGFALLLVLGHFAIFNLVWLDTIFGDRFAWYFALVAVPIFFYRFRQNRLILALMLLATLGVSGWRLGKLLENGAVPVLAATTQVAPIGAIYPEYFLTSNPHPVVPAGAIQIEPPIYHYQKTASGATPSDIHETIRLVHPGTN
jgi:hypothetical protein